MSKINFNLDIYTYQIDYVGHVSNIVYVQWMEIGRTILLETIGLPLPILEKKGIAPILIHTDIKYKKALYIHNKVKCEVWISELMNASAIINFNFFNEKNELAAFGFQKGLFIHRDKVKPYRLTGDERKLFEKVLIK
ncbi:MAG: thioesterase [Ignavibacteriae bacterium]|nr:MAG: thioesterase [Ignavibacteriota bacterium]